MHNSYDKIEKIRIFQSLFNGRKDVFARFWENSASGKSGCAPVKDDNGNLLELTVNFIALHLSGQQLIGIYPLLQDNTSYFMAIDFDEDNWLQDSVKVMHFAQQKSIPCYLERSKSGNGGHLWFFFETTVPAFKSRQLAKHLISEAGLYDNENSFDRIFPNQDEHTGKGFGNLIALPLNMMYLQKGNTAFIQENGETGLFHMEYSTPHFNPEKSRGRHSCSSRFFAGNRNIRSTKEHRA